MKKIFSILFLLISINTFAQKDTVVIKLPKGVTTDTSNLRRDINGKLAIADTATMLANYQKIANAFSKALADALYKPIGYIPTWTEISGKPAIVFVADTANMLKSYTLLSKTKADSIVLANAINGKQPIGDYALQTQLDPAFVNSEFDTTTRALTLTRVDGTSQSVVIPKGTANGLAGIASLSSSRTGDMVSVMGDNGTTTTFSTNDADSATRAHLSDLDIKVDKVAGKDLSTNDYTTAEKTKLSGIATGAEVNVNPDWNAVSGDAQILNKPTIPDVTGKVNVGDTSNMLKPYALLTKVKADSSTLAAAINTKQPAGTYATGTGTASGTNTGDETAATIKSKLSITTLSGVNTGDQDLSGLVPKTTTVNGQPLSGNITIPPTDISGKVDKTTTVNGKPLSSNIVIAQSDIANLTTDIAAKQNIITNLSDTSKYAKIGASYKVSQSDSISAKLRSEIQVAANGGVTLSQVDSAANLRVAKTTTVNGQPLSSNVTIAIPTVPTTVSSFTNDANYTTTSALTSGLAGKQNTITNLDDTVKYLKAADIAGKVDKTTTVNGKALSTNIVISATDINTGTLPHAQLPALVSGDIPNNTANTTGNAGTVTNGLYSTGTYANPAWITSLAYTKITGVPAFLTSVDSLQFSTRAMTKKQIDSLGALISGQVAGVSSVNSKTGAVTLTKSDIGLGSVDNTPDLSKPISTATQTALNLKLGTSDLGVKMPTIVNSTDYYPIGIQDISINSFYKNWCNTNTNFKANFLYETSTDSITWTNATSTLTDAQIASVFLGNPYYNNDIQIPLNTYGRITFIYDGAAQTAGQFLGFYLNASYGSYRMTVERYTNATPNVWETILAKEAPVSAISGTYGLPATAYFTTAAGSSYANKLRFTFKRTVYGQVYGITALFPFLYNGAGIQDYNYTADMNINFPKKIVAPAFIKSGGTSSQFLKADGSVDANTYLTSASIAGKLNVSDTTSMLSPYLKTAIASSQYAAKGTTLSSYGITDGVNTTGAQTIAGAKTFSNLLTITDGTNNIAIGASTISMYPANSSIYAPNGVNLTYWNGSAVTTAIRSTSTGIIQIPTIINAIGDYVTRNSTTGDLTIRTLAQTQTDLGIISKANDNAVVHLTGNETVNGDKTFTGTTMFGGGTNTVVGISYAGKPTVNMYLHSGSGNAGFGFNSRYNGDSSKYEVLTSGWGGVGTVLELSPSSGLNYKKITGGVGNPTTAQSLFYVSPTGSVTFPLLPVNAVGDYMTINSTSGVVTRRTAAQTLTDIGAEPSFTKNTAFNKNFGITAGTVPDAKMVMDSIAAAKAKKNFGLVYPQQAFNDSTIGISQTFLDSLAAKNNPVFTGTIAKIGSDTLATKADVRAGGGGGGGTGFTGSMSVVAGRDYPNDSVAVVVGGLSLWDAYRTGNLLKTVVTIPTVVNNSPYFNFTIDNSSGTAVPHFYIQSTTGYFAATVNWGDGTTANSYTTTGYIEPTHTYASNGVYNVSINFTSGIDQVTDVNINGDLGGVNNVTTIDKLNLLTGLKILSLWGNKLTNGFAPASGIPPTITTMDLANNGMTVSGVNNSLVYLDSKTFNAGAKTLTITQSPSAAPSGAGATAKTNLTSKGWTITSN